MCVRNRKKGCSCKLTPWAKKKLLQTFIFCVSIWMFGQSKIFSFSFYVDYKYMLFAQATWCWTVCPATTSVICVWWQSVKIRYLYWQGRRSSSSSWATTCLSVWPHTTTHINLTYLFLSSLWSDLSMWGHFLIVLNLGNPNLRSAHKNYAATRIKTHFHNALYLSSLSDLSMWGRRLEIISAALTSSYLNWETVSLFIR